ncbi:hypothetical protein [Desulfovibrio fairfieldensis]|uniref:RelA/SpoT domain-containing protein n=1 Tax=Desulfovibrio fairfieldensis TaxID=44742 RepID=A0A0X8JJX1_9BACT|nr:hypothetical protein [Desulfovibrio fairfieldensis]AMD90135.1 hypothetical protein AXF13_08360 [Desulfovibrio fairfieldensis]
MKIASCIREIYKERFELYGILKKLVDEIIRSQKNDRWHFESRIKEELSYALKLETGRYSSPDIDDFYAATIVVEDYSKIDQALDLVSNNFEILIKRPTDNVFGKQKPWDFQFTDIRLVCQLGEKWSDKTGLCNLNFEIQIKTFLQHAWSIATHDLVYKSHSPNWALERVAYQLKSMLEHAELSILEAKTLGESKLLQRDHLDYRHIEECISIFHEFWDEKELPPDLKRLAENTSQFLKLYESSVGELRAALEAKKAELGGNLYLNISPFNTIIEALYSKDRAKFITCLDKLESKKRSLIIPNDVGPAVDGEICKRKCIVIVKQ